jgi:hypothetical protein
MINKQFVNAAITPTKKPPAQDRIYRSLKDICRESELLAEKEGVKLTTKHYLAVPIIEGVPPKYLGIRDFEMNYD